MKTLFVHQNYPGQFKHLAPAVAAQPGAETVAMCMHQRPLTEPPRVVRYRAMRGTTPQIHPWVADFETKAIRGEAAFRTALALRDDGFNPDVIVAHPGWGESLFLKEVWPKARMGIYCEFYYHTQGFDAGFDPEFESPDVARNCRLILKNVNNLVHFDQADAGLSPTHWQAITFPEPFRQKITVVHDGVDTTRITPNPAVRIRLTPTRALTRDDEVITFVARNLEPYRGYHIFMRLLPELLKRRPKAHVVIVGGTEVSYGAAPPTGKTWRDIFLDEVRSELDMSRVHLVGTLPHPNFIALLQLSRVHVYLTYPFVLSWSLIEAMSAGCAIVASDTPPLREVIFHGDNGRLAGFFDRDALLDQVCDLLDNPAERERLGANARAFAQANYDLNSICLPGQLKWVESLASL
jgi:glycosyltransferase involved in cell wall biosynthesis